MITEHTKKVIPIKPGDAKRVGRGCFYLDMIIWLNGGGIELGDRVSFNYGCYLNGFGGLVIGDDCGIGPYVAMHTANHRFDDLEVPIRDQGWEGRPIEIGADCFIGMGTCVVPGVRIGEGSVIGAGSVVVADIPPYSIAAGVPARVLRQRH